MTVVDLSSVRLAPLDIDAGGGKVYQIRPTADDLRRMGVFTAAAEAAIREGTSASASVSAIRDRMDPDDYDLLDSDESLARVQLGGVAYGQMVKDGIPAPDIFAFGRYSMDYHTKGQNYAAAVFASVVRSDDAEPVAGFPKASKSGRRTASVSRTKTASTKGTGGSRSDSGKSSSRSSK